MLSEEIKSNLAQSILEVFPKALPPTSEKLTSHKCDECNALKDNFKGIKWWEAEYELISENFGQLPLFTPTAHHYYFPAYLLCDLDESNPLYHSTIREFIVYDLTPSKEITDFKMNRKNLFSDKQRQLVVHYLEQLLEDEDSEYIFEDIEKALTFWKH